MSFSVGIVGLPNVGKSTLFKALTKKQVDIASYPFTTVSPNVGIVAVPDERLEKIAEIVKPEKVTPTIIEFVDIAGLVKGAHKGEGLGNQFLAQIRNCDAILEVVRAFSDEAIEHIEGSPNPERDIEIIKMELIMKDLETIEKHLEELEKTAEVSKEAQQKSEIIKRIKETLSRGEQISGLNLISREKEIIKEFQFLTEKPIVYVINTGNQQPARNFFHDREKNFLVLNLKLEEEISELSLEEKKEFGAVVDPHTRTGTDSVNLGTFGTLSPFGVGVDQLILNCYNILDLITFYTIAGGKETRAWTIKRGTTTPQAGGKVHSDFKERFIRAEVIFWQKLVEAGNWQKAKELGQIKTVGRDNVVEDGDVIEFKI